MSATEYPRWQNAYEKALLELDRKKLPARLAEAATAIALRFRELKLTSNGDAERQALDDALRNLQIIQREKLD